MPPLRQSVLNCLFRIHLNFYNLPAHSSFDHILMLLGRSTILKLSSVQTTSCLSSFLASCFAASPTSSLLLALPPSPLMSILSPSPSLFASASSSSSLQVSHTRPTRLNTTAGGPSPTLL